LPRGPAEHAVRDRIVEAANECFALYGYSRTTVAVLAREIGYSKSYIYRFFDSKQAIGEAICASRLKRMLSAARAAIDAADTASDKFRRLFAALVGLGTDLFFQDRKIYEIVAYAAAEDWNSTKNYREALRTLVAEVVSEGRKNGEFECLTPLATTCDAVFYAMMPFLDPLQLERNLDLLPDAEREMANLILRSLAARRQL